MAGLVLVMTSGSRRIKTQAKTPPRRAAFSCVVRKEKGSKHVPGLYPGEFPAFGGPGSDLLSRVLGRSIIGAGEFNGRVRNGIGFRLPAIATKPAKGRKKQPTGRTMVRTRTMRAIKPIELLVPVSFTRCRASTPGLSTWWSTTALKGEIVSRWVSRLDAFSGYPVRT